MTRFTLICIISVEKTTAISFMNFVNLVISKTMNEITYSIDIYFVIGHSLTQNGPSWALRQRLHLSAPGP